MRIDPNDQIAGHPIIAVRNLLRRRVFGPDAVRKTLEVDEAEAARVVEALKAEKYICGLFGENPPPDRWQTTPKGSMLAGATTKPPITRDEAERLLRELMARVRLVRDNDKFLYEVGQVLVFGSYLREVDELNDVDLVVKLRVKAKFRDNLKDVLRDRLEAAQAIGLRLKKGTDPRQYPRRGVLGFLQGASPYLTLHRENEMEMIAAADRRRGLPNPGTPHKVIYDAGGQRTGAGRNGARRRPRGPDG